MATAPPSTRQTLCVALVRDGKVLSERWFAPGEPVRVGRWPRNHFVLSDPNAPGRALLFDGRRDGHTLCVLDRLRGRLSLEDGTPAVDQLCPAGGDNRFNLPPGARGRLELHGSTLLFKVVPEALASSYLARTWRASLVEDEPVFHTFLTGFSAIASVVMVGLYNVTPVETSLDGAPPELSAAFMALPPPVVEANMPAADEPSVRSRRHDNRTASHAPAQPRDIGAETLERSALLRLLAHHGNSKQHDVFAGEDDLFERTRQSLDHVDTIQVAGLAPEVRSGQGTRPTDGTAGELVDGGGGSTTIRDDTLKTPRTRFTLEPDELPTAGSSEARTYDAIRGYGRTIGSCYERALNKDPQLSGRLVLTLYVRSGRVTSAEVEENSTGERSLGDCAAKAARSWRLPDDVEGEFPVPYLLSPG